VLTKWEVRGFKLRSRGLQGWRDLGELRIDTEEFRRVGGMCGWYFSVDDRVMLLRVPVYEIAVRDLDEAM
jgi:hypothetical protein